MHRRSQSISRSKCGRCPGIRQLKHSHRRSDRGQRGAIHEAAVSRKAGLGVAVPMVASLSHQFVSSARARCISMMNGLAVHGGHVHRSRCIRVPGRSHPKPASDIARKSGRTRKDEHQQQHRRDQRFAAHHAIPILTPAIYLCDAACQTVRRKQCTAAILNVV
jgi:hypothetical protein